MKYHVGQIVWVWRGYVKDEIVKAKITSYCGKASFEEDVYDFDYIVNGVPCGSSGAVESDIFETLITAKHAKFKMARIMRDVCQQIEKIAIHNKQLMSDEMKKLLSDD